MASDFKHKPGNGSIFPNDKGDNDARPDWKGKIVTPNGNEWEIAGWVKPKEDSEFISLSIKEVYDKDKSPI